MGIGSSGVVNCANTYLGTANYTVADGYVADRTVIVDGNGPAQLNLNFARDEVLDPRIAFSRTSNATRVNAQGLIEYAPHNLLTNSENFDNAAWLFAAPYSITPNAITGPDGTTTADAIVLDSGSTSFNSNIPRQSITKAASAIQYTHSCYVKAKGTTTAVRLSDFGLSTANTAAVIVSLIDGSVISAPAVSGTFTGASVVVESLQNGWFRVALTYTTDTATTLTVRHFPYNGSVQLVGDGVSGLYLWGAQLNIDSLQPYYTTSVKNLLGYTQNFENAAWTKSNSSVLTNLLTYSQEFDNAAWVKSNSSISATKVTAPDGSITGQKLVEDNTSNLHYSIENVSATSGTRYVYSLYAKAGERTNIQLYFSTSSGIFDSTNAANSVVFDLTNGVATAGASITAFSITSVGNGWYRCMASRSASATGSGAIGIIMRDAYSISTSGYAGNGTSGTYIWGAQLVQGTNPEEYTVTTSAPAPIQVMGPLGFLGAEKLVEDTANITHFIQQNVTVAAGIPYTLSLYAKESQTSPKRYLTLLLPSAQFGSNKRATFDLATGTLTTVNSPATATMTTVGDGWWRCEISATATVSGATGIGIRLFNAAVDTLNVYQGDGTSGIYIFGAQLSDSASLDPYSYNFGAAPTSSAYYGPRFDYDPVTLAPKGLLIEEQRTNSIRNNTMQGAVAGTPGTLPTDWQSNVGGLAISVVGTGTENGIAYIDVRLSGTTTQNFANVRFVGNTQVVASNGQTWTNSFYCRIVSGNTTNITAADARLGFRDSGGSGLTETGVDFLSSISATSLSVARRVVTSAATNASTAYVDGRLNITAVVGAAIDITLRIGLPQLEQGAFPTSVIPTTSAQVTRTADNASMVGTNFSSWYNQSEGTIYSEWDVFGFPARPCSLALDNNNRMYLVSTETFAALDGTVNSVFQGTVIVTGSYAAYTTHKQAGAYQLNNTSVAINGVVSAADTTYLIPTVDQLLIGSSLVSSPTRHNGHIQSIKYFNKRLLNSYLQSLTQ